MINQRLSSIERQHMLETLQKLCLDLQTDHELLENDHESLKDAHDTLLRCYDTLQESHQRVQEESSHLYQQYEQKVKKYQKLRVIFDNLKKENDMNKKKLEKMKHEMNIIEKERDSLQIEFDDLWIDNCSIVEERDRLRSRMLQYEEDIEARDELISDLDSQLDDLRIENSTINLQNIQQKLYGLNVEQLHQLIVIAQNTMTQKIESKLDEELCIICLDNAKCIALVPCGHLCICLECSQPLKQCPVCRAIVKGSMKVFK